MTTLATWWMAMAATDAPALPDALWMRSGMALGWALVLGFLGAALTARCSLTGRRAVAGALALWALLPGPASVTYWLGLAFHAPSITTVLVCALGLKSQLWPTSSAKPCWHSGPLRWWWAGAGVLLGYLLLLDTFAVLPVQLYAWGFSTQALLVVLALALLPWVVRGAMPGESGWAAWVLPAALLVFVLSRLPTGNLWDAVLDPWLWGGLQVLLLRAGWRRIRALLSATRG